MKSAINKENVLPNAMIRDILVANPQSAKSEEILEALDQRITPVPEYMKNQILSGTNILSPKEQLEGQIACYSKKYADAIHEIVAYYKFDAGIIHPVDSLINFLNYLPDLDSKYHLALLYADGNDTANCSSVLGSIPAGFNLSSEQMAIHGKYSQYINLFSRMKADTLGLFPLDSAEIDVLETLHNDTSIAPGIYARNVLITAGLHCYQEPINIPAETKSEVVKTFKSSDVEEEILKVYPNPSDNYFIVEYDLANTDKRFVIQIRNMEGRLLQEYVIAKRQDQFIVPAECLINGTYMIQLVDNDKIMAKCKINIFH